MKESSIINEESQIDLIKTNPSDEESPIANKSDPINFKREIVKKESRIAIHNKNPINS